MQAEFHRLFNGRVPDRTPGDLAKSVRRFFSHGSTEVKGTLDRRVWDGSTEVLERFWLAFLVTDARKSTDKHGVRYYPCKTSIKENADSWYPSLPEKRTIFLSCIRVSKADRGSKNLIRVFKHGCTEEHG